MTPLDQIKNQIIFEYCRNQTRLGWAKIVKIELDDALENMEVTAMLPGKIHNIECEITLDE